MFAYFKIKISEVQVFDLSAATDLVLKTPVLCAVLSQNTASAFTLLRKWSTLPKCIYLRSNLICAVNNSIK